MTTAAGRAQDRAAALHIAGVGLLADAAGILYWPEERLMVVADLHLEKGSGFAARGQLLPPYDTAATLARLNRVIARYAPRGIIALGDSFHDGGGPARLAPNDRDELSALQRGRDWIWIAGNHDPDAAPGIGGAFAESLALGALHFRHEPDADAPDGEIAGHLHPLARVSRRGRTIARRCFAADASRAILPAFGAYAGGLNVRHEAFAGMFGNGVFMAHVLGAERIYAFPVSRCCG